MLLLMGWHDEKAMAEGGREKTGGYVTESYQPTAPATTPATTTAIRPGRIGETAVEGGGERERGWWEGVMGDVISSSVCCF